ncbi:hypothetical protein ACRBEV_29160 [Methylobacterium phyllosphaerae]
MTIDDSAIVRLREIAAVVGCPVEAFFASADEGVEAGMTHELIRLWNALQEPQARQRVLTIARHELLREARGADAAE